MFKIVRRIYIEKREDLYAEDLCREIAETLSIKNLEQIRFFKRYDIEGLSDDEFQKTLPIVFSEPPVDVVFDSLPSIPNSKIFSIEFLPGQYDQRADSAAQCVQLITQKDRPIIHTAKTFAFIGNISEADFRQIQQYLINPVESRIAGEDIPATLKQNYELPANVKVLDDFLTFDLDSLKKFHAEFGFSMSLEDLEFCQKYFRDNHAPTITELRVIDTYWSDHCRHTTFNSAIDEILIDDPLIQKTFDEYITARNNLYVDEKKDISLMDLGTIAAKILKREGTLKHLDQSEEINACSIETEIDGQPWLVMFKNETHNHPTEIEPFGGAATCLGGAIRDPLSGRSYVYQSMRITGAADPRTPISQTLPGKLPQKKICREAANGFSSYGNQIGLATGLVHEVYHPGYVAKRMEIGAVIAAAPKSNVVRSRPSAGDVILLVGGRTGRDGCGGATGSSKSHTTASLTTAGAEVQKGNAPTERKLQRLFRNPEASRLIKRCNDFGAGGVSVAIGELARGLKINLDAVPKKYEGLDGTELAISESQERMAVVIDPVDVEKFIRLASDENLECSIVAEVTSDDRLTMYWRRKKIVDIDRKFLDTNGIKQHVSVKIHKHKKHIEKNSTDWIDNLKNINVSSQKGLIEKFDSTVGAGTILMPLGGKTQLTPQNGMVGKISSNTCSVMSFGFDAADMDEDPFRGAVVSVISSLAKITAVGADFAKSYLTFQEYFERLESDSVKWGKPFAALLGAFKAQIGMGVAAIGGKDSMSGSFENLNVPPTLVSFAVAVANADDIISSEFKSAGNKIYFVHVKNIFDFEDIKKVFNRVHNLILEKKIVASMVVEAGGISAAVSKMCLGNYIGAEIQTDFDLFEKFHGSMVVESTDDILDDDFFEIGKTIDEEKIYCSEKIYTLGEIQTAFTEPLEKIYPTRVKKSKMTAENVSYSTNKIFKSSIKIAKPRVFIPTFPGTNCEYDSANAFENAGAVPNILVVKNLTSKDIIETVNKISKSIDDSQIIMFPGGFSGGDEPDGSGKFIAAMFRNPRIIESIEKFLSRDGLILGICNGFQALLKLGLLPFGKIRPLTEQDPTLTFNTIGRHVSCMVRTKISSKMSPWLKNVELDSVQTIAVSHGEGRFVATKDIIDTLKSNGQIATQYVDDQNLPTMSMPWNPNGSVEAIEGITSSDGRIFGKMGHSERIGRNISKNVPGAKDQKIFLSGVEYFS